ncbi:MAG: hypothetical protein EON60_12330 [Alphaproteobacteria bacterium]|nr:MAG: hypothetical protein EON60_12330 [Alphaproteobacteria bacterium]
MEYLRRDMETCLKGLPSVQRCGVEAQPYIEDAAKRSDGNRNSSLKAVTYSPDERRIYADFRPEGSHVYFPVDILTGTIDHYEYPQ